MLQEFLVDMEEFENDHDELNSEDVLNNVLCDDTSCHCDCIGGGCYCITD